MTAPILTLTHIVEAALAAFPALAYLEGGSRADAAAELIDERKLARLAPLPNGHDVWSVNRQTVSIKGGTCTCDDLTAPVASNTRLCKHMLAAMFVVKLENAMMARLVDLFQAAPGDTLTLRVDVMYKDQGRIYYLAGHHYRGVAWVRYTYDERQQFSEELFAAACRVANWELTSLPVAQPGYAFNYMLRRCVAGAEPSIYQLRDHAGATVDRISQRARMAALAERFSA